MRSPHSTFSTTSAGFEPDIFWRRTRNPEPLDEEAKLQNKNRLLRKNPKQAAVWQYSLYCLHNNRSGQIFCPSLPVEFFHTNQSLLEQRQGLRQFIWITRHDKCSHFRFPFLPVFFSGMFFLRLYYFLFARRAINLWLRAGAAWFEQAASVLGTGMFFSSYTMPLYLCCTYGNRLRTWSVLSASAGVGAGVHTED